jgi:hypothetical protein
LIFEHFFENLSRKFYCLNVVKLTLGYELGLEYVEGNEGLTATLVALFSSK